MSYFEIGILNGKTKENLGTLWRGAYQLGAAGIFTVNNRYRTQASDTYKTWRQIPLRQFKSLEEFLASRPHASILVGVEQGGIPLVEFEHPDNAIYLLGAEDHGLTNQALAACNRIVSIEYVRHGSYNVAMAGTLVMYDRMIKQMKEVYCENI